MAGAVVLLGGTFDPVHEGHLAAARGLRAAVDAAATWLVPSSRPPHRPPPLAAPADRLAMVRLAVAGEPGLEACALEVERGGTSFTRDTVVTLQARHPGVQFWLALGADAARGLPGWHEVHDLLQRVPLLLYDRPGAPALVAGPAERLVAPAGLVWAAVDAPRISASRIRARLAAGDPCHDVLPTAVSAYIAQRGLYRGPAGWVPVSAAGADGGDGAQGAPSAGWDNRAP